MRTVPPAVFAVLLAAAPAAAPVAAEEEGRLTCAFDMMCAPGCTMIEGAVMRLSRNLDTETWAMDWDGGSVSAAMSKGEGGRVFHNLDAAQGLSLAVHDNGEAALTETVFESDILVTRTYTGFCERPR